MRYTDITFAIVVWNDAERLRALLQHVRPWFEHIAVAVQESPDETLDVAREWADVVVTDEHQGYGDASFGLLQQAIRTKWVLRLDADEWPSDDLLENLGRMTEEAALREARGVWIAFRSWTDGVEWEPYHSHLRLWWNDILWPPTLHSRPMIDDTYDTGPAGIPGHIDHRRSLDEMIRDYLNYYRIGLGHPGWDDHNRLMMREACQGAAAARGWLYVKGHDWWPGVLEAAFGGEDPMEDYQVVFCSGPSCSGTRMLYDMVNALGLRAVHASIPGYDDLPDGPGLDIAHPNWWPVDEWIERYGYGKWVVMRRGAPFAAQCAVKRGFVANVDEYRPYLDRALDILDEAPAMDSFTLLYEDLVKDPQLWYDRIADFLGVPHVPVGDIFDGNQKYLSEPAPVKAPARRSRKKG
jgi:glycosyltransferase involved in cell wall biosynthesis